MEKNKIRKPGRKALFEDIEVEGKEKEKEEPKNDIEALEQQMEELKAELQTSVEEYLAFCAEIGKEPEKPFSGKLSLRTTPEIHRRIAIQAARRRVSMNSFVESVLESAVSED